MSRRGDACVTGSTCTRSISPCPKKGCGSGSRDGNGATTGSIGLGWESSCLLGLNLEHPVPISCAGERRPHRGWLEGGSLWAQGC